MIPDALEYFLYINASKVRLLIYYPLHLGRNEENWKKNDGTQLFILSSFLFVKGKIKPKSCGISFSFIL